MMGSMAERRRSSRLMTPKTAYFGDGERRFQAIVSSCFARW
jgi:hypothetical protein